MSRPINKIRYFSHDSSIRLTDDRGDVRPTLSGRAIPYDRYDRSLVLPIRHNER